MTGQQLRNSILQEAIQGRLVPNVLQPGEKTGAELLQDILAERQKKENQEKGKKAKKLSLSVIEEEPWELPEGWCWCKLKDIIDFTSSGTTKNENIDKDSWILDLEDIEKETGRLLCKKRFRDVKSLSDKRAFVSGNVLYSKLRPYLNKCIIADENGYCTTEILAFDFGPIYNRYAQSFLMSPYFVELVNQGAAGVKMPRVNNKEANEIYFPLPPLSIQKAIVEKIEEVFPIVDEYDKAAGELKALNEALPDKLRKSVLQEAIHGDLVPNEIPAGEATAQELLQQILKERQDRENAAKGKKAKKLTLSEIEEEPWELPEGWCWCKLGSLVTLISGQDYEPSRYNDSGLGVPYITGASNLQNGRVLVNRWTTEPSVFAYRGDLLMVCKGSGVGKMAFCDIDAGHIARQIQCIRKESFVDMLYVQYVIEANLKSVISSANGVIPGVARNVLLDLYFPLPPLSIQKAIVAKIEEVFSAIDKLK